MLAEWRGLEYVFEVLRVLHKHPDIRDSKSIYSKITEDKNIEANLSYVQKILPRMVKANLLASSEVGYNLARPINEIMVSDVLKICTMPDDDSPLKGVCEKISEALTMTSVDEFYQFD